jgi:hypothetical protein
MPGDKLGPSWFDSTLNRHFRTESYHTWTDSRHRKNALFYETLRDAEVEICSWAWSTPASCAAPTRLSMTELQRHAPEVAANPAAWMPWNCNAAGRSANPYGANICEDWLRERWGEPRINADPCREPGRIAPKQVLSAGFVGFR